jgi:hypothetical protein
MEPKSDKTELALNLLKDWSLWLVSIQSSAIGLIVAFYEKELKVYLDNQWLGVAVLCFTGSIILSSWVIAALPDIVSRIDTQNNDCNIHDMSAFRKTPFIPLWLLTATQHWLFIIGIGCFALSFYLKMN